MVEQGSNQGVVQKINTLTLNLKKKQWLNLYNIIEAVYALNSS
jgi:hypothetical protein